VVAFPLFMGFNQHRYNETDFYSNEKQTTREKLKRAEIMEKEAGKKKAKKKKGED
jgi:hypothetical protein